jgi:hypothetical protein
MIELAEHFSLLTLGLSSLLVVALERNGAYLGTAWSSNVIACSTVGRTSSALAWLAKRMNRLTPAMNPGSRMTSRQGLAQQTGPVLRCARRNQHHPADICDPDAPVDQARPRRPKARRIEYGRRIWELVSPLARERCHQPHVVARTIERGSFLGHDTAVHFTARDRKVHVGSSLVSGDDLARS